MTTNLKISHVKISNILGIKELEFAPGGFTEVSGAGTKRRRDGTS